MKVALNTDSPLSRLLSFLAQEFPSERNCPSNFDQFQRLDGELDRAVYESQIFHLARRMIILAQFAVRNSASYNEAKLIKEAIEEVFDTTIVSKQGTLYQLVYECYVASKKKLPASQKSQLTKSAKKSAANCYFCGVELTYKSKTDDDFCEAEHFLPRSLGGGNDVSNVKHACKKCNSLKKSRIAGSDLHFESLVYPFTDEGPNRINQFHIFAAKYFREPVCTICGKSASSQGGLNIRHENANDAWHLFNINLICFKCSESP